MGSSIKIIQKGELPSEKVYRLTCDTCKTLFEFKKVEAELKSDQRDGDYLEVHCPLCNKPCTISPFRTFTPSYNPYDR